MTNHSDDPGRLEAFLDTTFNPSLSGLGRAAQGGGADAVAVAYVDFIEAATLLIVGADAQYFPREDVRYVLEDQRSYLRVPSAARKHSRRLVGQPRGELLANDLLDAALEPMFTLEAYVDPS